MKSVQIPGLAVRPLISDKSIVACTSCQAASARWELAKGKEIASHFVCSTCFLYRLPAMQPQGDALNRMVDAVEKTIGRRFDRSPEGMLLNAEDADRIAYGIVMAQRHELQRGLQ